MTTIWHIQSSFVSLPPKTIVPNSHFVATGYLVHNSCFVQVEKQVSSRVKYFAGSTTGTERAASLPPPAPPQHTQIHKFVQKHNFPAEQNTFRHLKVRSFVGFAIESLSPNQKIKPTSPNSQKILQKLLYKTVNQHAFTRSGGTTGTERAASLPPPPNIHRYTSLFKNTIFQQSKILSDISRYGRLSALQLRVSRQTKK
jgi:hypothetical protein